MQKSDSNCKEISSNHYHLNNLTKIFDFNIFNRIIRSNHSKLTVPPTFQRPINKSDLIESRKHVLNTMSTKNSLIFNQRIDVFPINFDNSPFSNCMNYKQFTSNSPKQQLSLQLHPKTIRNIIRYLS